MSDKPRLFAGLFRRYARVLMLLVGVALVASGAVEIAFNYRESLQASATVQRAEVNSAAARIEQYLALVAAQVRDTASLPWGSRLLTLEDRREEYHRLMKINPAIMEIRNVDAQGREQLRVSRTDMDRVGGGADLGGHAVYLEAKPDAATYGQTYFRQGAEPHVTLGLRDRDAGRAVTLVELNLKFVGDVLRVIQVGAAGRVYVVDSANQLVAHPNLSLVLRRTNLSSYEPLRSLKQAPAGLTAATGLEGNEVMISAASIPSAGWLAVVEQPREEVLAPVLSTVRRTAVLFVAGLLMALVASYFLGRRLARPIIEVRRAAGQIARGDLAARIDVKTGDEVEALADEFNNMAAQLQDYTTGLERKVAEKTAELQLANRHKSEFLANMSHELRTPLNAVIGFSDALREEMFGKLNPKQAEYVRDIHASGQHLLSLINDILDLSKIEAGRMELDLAEFNVASALENCRTLIRERAHSRGLKLAFDLPADLGTWVADERKVKQVVLNLLSNAVKFTPPGGEVALAARREADALAVSVRDTGPGIASGDQATIFQEFRQLSTVGDAKNEGTGLGLSLSKRLVELHGGTIAVESAAGQGATFTVRFPALHPEAKNA